MYSNSYCMLVHFFLSARDRFNLCFVIQNNFETIIELLKEQQCSINALRSEFRQMSEPSANNNNGQFKVNVLELNLDSKIADVVSTHFLKNSILLNFLGQIG